jgi:L-asparagine oxygenase
MITQISKLSRTSFDAVQDPILSNRSSLLSSLKSYQQANAPFLSNSVITAINSYNPVLFKQNWSQRLLHKGLSPDIDLYTKFDICAEIAENALKNSLPYEVKAALNKFRSEKSCGSIYLQNMPVDEVIPPTPEDGSRCLAKENLSEACILGITRILKTKLHKEEKERDNQYFHQIISTLDRPNERSSYGSTMDIDFHTECIQQNNPLEYLLLLCLRGDPKVKTSIVVIEKVLNFIKNSLLSETEYNWFFEQLKKPQFLMSASSSFKSGEDLNRALPILEERVDRRIFRLNINDGRIVGLTPEGMKVIKIFKEVFSAIGNSRELQKEFVQEYYLKKGDMLIIKNWEALHRRDAFTIDKENWRWLQRVYMNRA